MAAKKKLTFEEQLEKVEELIGQMEDGSMSLDVTLKRYEEGMAMISAMEKELKSAQQRLTVLRKGADGQDEEVALEEDA